MSGRSYTWTVVTVHPDEPAGVDLPDDGSSRSARPSMSIPDGARVALSVEVNHYEDEGAAAWWRQLAAKAEQIAAWYDTRDGAE